VEVAFGGFRQEKLGSQDFSGSVVLHAQSGEAGAAAFQPVVRRTIELHQFPDASDARAALAMSGSPTFARRAEAGLAQQTTQRFAAEGQALVFDEFLAEMMIIEAGILGAGQMQNPLAGGFGQPAGAGAAAVGVCQRRLPLFAQTFLQAFHLAHAQRQESGGAGTRQPSLKARTEHAYSLQFLLTQRECLLSHGVTFSRCRSGVTESWS